MAAERTGHRTTSWTPQLFDRVKNRARRALRVVSHWQPQVSALGRHPLIEIQHASTRFARRYGDFTANVSGRLACSVQSARYRLNGDAWRDIRHLEPRVPPRHFTIELSASELREGVNTLIIEAVARDASTARESHQFRYDSHPITPPFVVDWHDYDLDVQDGPWERIRDGQIWRVRPLADTEKYDRIIVVSGAFAGGREVETEAIFRYASGKRLFGFGVLPLWGGRPDSRGGSPRGGWNFGLSWYYSKYEAAGLEFSYKDGDDAPDWIASYRNLTIERDAHYCLRIQCGPFSDATGRPQGFVQRLKWWKQAESEPEDWMEIRDTEGAPIPSGEYGIALITHCCQVEFGPVTVKPWQAVPPSV